MTAISLAVIGAPLVLMAIFFRKLYAHCANDEMRAEVREMHQMMLVLAGGLALVVVSQLMGSLWYSAAGVLLAITGVASYFNRLRKWFATAKYAKDKANMMSVLMWLCWLSLFILLITQFVFIWIS